MQTIFRSMKVNNEIELCEVADMDCKKLIERELLNNRISYYMRWTKSSFFHPAKSHCIICVNENALDEAEEIVNNICDDFGYHVKFLFRKSTANYLPNK